VVEHGQAQAVSCGRPWVPTPTWRLASLAVRLLPEPTRDGRVPPANHKLGRQTTRSQHWQDQEP